MPKGKEEAPSRPRRPAAAAELTTAPSHPLSQVPLGGPFRRLGRARPGVRTASAPRAHAHASPRPFPGTGPPASPLPTRGRGTGALGTPRRRCERPAASRVVGAARGRRARRPPPSRAGGEAAAPTARAGDRAAPPSLLPAGGGSAGAGSREPRARPSRGGARRAERGAAGPRRPERPRPRGAVRARRWERGVCPRSRPSPRAPPAAGPSSSGSQGRPPWLRGSVGRLGRGAELVSPRSLRAAPPAPRLPLPTLSRAAGNRAPLSNSSPLDLPLRVLPPFASLRI